MKIREFIILAVAGAATFAAGCSGGGSPAPSSGNVLPSNPSPNPGALSTFTYNASALSGAHFVANAKVASLSVDIVPRLQNAAGLQAYAAAVSDPRNGAYRHFLTPQQIGETYGASQTDYTAATTYFQSQGIKVDGWPQHLLLHVTGTQAQMEAALHTRFGWYQNGKDVFVAPESTPLPPANVPIAGAANLVMRSTTFVDSTAVRPNGASNGILFGYGPQQVAAAFDYTGAYHAGYTGKGITIGIIGTGGFSPLDVPTYRTMFGIPGSGITTMVAATDADNPGNAASGFAPPPPITGPCRSATPTQPTASCNPEDGETQIDTEQAASLAYDANVHYYLAYNPNDGCGAIGSACPPGAGGPFQGLYEYNAELESAIAENASDVLSLSFGGPEDANVGYEFNSGGHGITPLELAALVSEGVAVFVSSGDSGAEQCQTWSSAPSPNSVCVSYPSTDPSVVSVGGTNTPLNAMGQFIGPLTGWGDQTSEGFGGSGGGISKYFSLPAFQSGAAGVTSSMRNVPDVALNGDDHTGVAVLMYGDPKFADNKEVVSYGGTSVAAPESAAMWALVLQACKQSAACATASGARPYRLGNPNPLFYKIYSNATEYPQVFFDVLFGDNAQACEGAGATPCPGTDPGYQAGKGYDLVTGIGAPSARALIKAVVGV